MNIILLEDDDDKRSQIRRAVIETEPNANILEVANFYEYQRAITNSRFDLILLDLIVPRSNMDKTTESHHIQVIEVTRDFRGRSLRTPAIVFTKFLDESEDFIQDLNIADINVISFDDDEKWKEALRLKILAAKPKPTYDFVIICALEKEAQAFEGVADVFGDLMDKSGLMCRDIEISEFRGVIVLAGRMGLVSSAVAATIAINQFEPRLICMSGICGGIPSESTIYDLLVSEVCHQHDAGKWSDRGFKSEHYDVQIDAGIKRKLEEVRANPKTRRYLSENINVRKSEYPIGMEEVVPNIRIAVTSSGSAVMAEEGKTSNLSVGQRKLAGFDMEIYSLYEAARISPLRPAFFAVKSVVDDGDKNKGDRFHRVGCLLSAKFVVTAIRSGIGFS